MKEQLITSAQLKAMQTIFSRNGWNSEERHEFIENYTDGRTSSTKELTFSEVKALLRSFNGNEATEQRHQQKEAKELVAAINKLSYGISFLNKGFSSDNIDDRKMNYAKINLFCRNRTVFRKDLTKMSVEELKEVHKQFEALHHKENGSKRRKKTGVDKAVQGDCPAIG